MSRALLSCRLDVDGSFAQQVHDELLLGQAPRYHRAVSITFMWHLRPDTSLACNTSLLSGYRAAVMRGLIEARVIGGLGCGSIAQTHDIYSTGDVTPHVDVVVEAVEEDW